MAILTSYSNSAIRGTHCGLCEKHFVAGQPAYKMSIPYDAMDVFYISDTGLVCEACAREHYGFFGNFHRIGDCRLCGRSVHTPWPTGARRGVYCCEHCRQKQYRPGKQTTYSTCEKCGESFLQKRSDSKYCSSKCRQKAYRQRAVKP